MMQPNVLSIGICALSSLLYVGIDGAFCRCFIWRRSENENPDGSIRRERELLLGKVLLFAGGLFLSNLVYIWILMNLLPWYGWPAAILPTVATLILNRRYINQQAITENTKRSLAYWSRVG